MALSVSRMTLVAAVLAAATALGLPANADPVEDLRSLVPANAFAFIPPQCYTRTLSPDGAVHNPCYACHVTTPAPNYARDSALQLSYDFPPPAARNRWTNLFVDRREQIAAIEDDAILAYVRGDNYHGRDGSIAIDARLDNLPAGWDINGDGIWSGYRPDIHFRFDAEGYDLAPDGTRTGWRSYGYYPLPGAFLPSNGSADDVAIRLPEAFREDKSGKTDWRVYSVNLAIVEALIKRADVPIAPTDERTLGVDLDRDGTLGTANHVDFAFAPLEGVMMHYVGRAGVELAEGDVHLAAGLYPERTEFVHSLRYLDIGADGSVEPAARLKELRYARKTSWRTYTSLMGQAMDDIREGHDNPDRPERFFGDVESGVSTGLGWRYQGFIEDAGGSLRPQTYEESLTCAGCHTGVGRTVDSTFSLARKVDGPGGWYHWDADHHLGALPDRIGPDGKGEYATYLRRNDAGDEFRANTEIRKRFFDDGVSDEQTFENLKRHIRGVTRPSAGRALSLDKAYRLVVEEQSFDKGRNPVLKPLDKSVWKKVEPGQPTGIEASVD